MHPINLPSGCFDDIQATPYKLRDPSWTPSQWSAERVCSESQHENFKMFNETMETISRGKFQPLKAPLTKRWEVATSNEKESCLKTAEMSCRLVCGVIAPNDPDKLYEALVKATEKQGLHDILSLTTAYKNAPTKNLKIQILSLYVLNYSTEELSDRQIKKARHQAKINGSGVPLKKAISHRVRIDMVKLDHFLTFVDRPYFYQDVAYGQRTLELESGERLAMPNIIRTMTRSTMITQCTASLK